MKHFAKMVNSFWLLNNFAKRSLLEFWRGSEYNFEFYGLLERQEDFILCDASI